MDLELELFGDLKDKSGSSSVGKVYMLSLSSQPVDHEDATTGERQKVRGSMKIIVVFYSVFHRVMTIIYKSSTYLHFWNLRISH